MRRRSAVADGDHYRVFRMPGGTGIHRPTFVLLHGVGLSHRSFTRLARLLRQAGDVVAIDLPGFGGTRRPTERRSVEQYARGIAAVLDQRGTADVIAVGHSMGCQFALELALTRPDLVSGVVMIGPVTDPRYRSMPQEGLRLIRDSALEPPRTNLMVAFDYLRCGPRWFLAECRAMLAYPTHARIAGLTRPLLVVRGARDPIAQPEWTAWLAAQAGEGRAVSTETHRHNVVHSNPPAVAGPIIRFAATLR